MKTTAGILSLAILLAGCQKTETPAGEAPRAAADAKAAVAQAPAVPTDPNDPRMLLTDEMLGKYVVYQTTVMPVMADTLAMGASALKNSNGGTNDFEKQVAADPRFRRVDAAQKEASAKSGLTAQTAAAIGKLVSEYVTERSMGSPEEKAKARTDFEQKFGTPAALAMDRHEAELTKLQEETLKAALGPANKESVLRQARARHRADRRDGGPASRPRHSDVGEGRPARRCPRDGPNESSPRPPEGRGPLYLA